MERKTKWLINQKIACHTSSSKRDPEPSGKQDYFRTSLRCWKFKILLPIPIQYMSRMQRVKEK